MHFKAPACPEHKSSLLYGWSTCWSSVGDSAVPCITISSLSVPSICDWLTLPTLPHRVLFPCFISSHKYCVCVSHCHQEDEHSAGSPAERPATRVLAAEVSSCADVCADIAHASSQARGRGRVNQGLDLWKSVKVNLLLRLIASCILLQQHEANTATMNGFIKGVLWLTLSLSVCVHLTYPFLIHSLFLIFRPGSRHVHPLLIAVIMPLPHPRQPFAPS